MEGYNAFRAHAVDPLTVIRHVCAALVAPRWRCSVLRHFRRDRLPIFAGQSVIGRSPARWFTSFPLMQRVGQFPCTPCISACGDLESMDRADCAAPEPLRGSGRIRPERDPFGGPVVMRLSVDGSWPTVGQTRLGCGRHGRSGADWRCNRLASPR